MNKDEQRIAIAEACGKNTEAFRFWWMSHGGQEWKESPHYTTIEQAEEAREGESHWSDTKPVESIRSCENVPRYLTDLNAMHEAEKVLDPDLYGQYEQNLRKTYPVFMGGGFHLLHAAAAQRAEAFLHTIGKWKQTS